MTLEKYVSTYVGEDLSARAEFEQITRIVAKLEEEFDLQSADTDSLAYFLGI